MSEDYEYNRIVLRDAMAELTKLRANYAQLLAVGISHAFSDALRDLDDALSALAPDALSEDVK